MKTRIVHLLLVALFPIILEAQTILSDDVDSLRKQLSSTKPDSTKITLYLELASHSQFDDPDSAIFYAKKAFALARKSGRPVGEAWALRTMALAMRSYGNDPIALQINLKALRLAEKYDLKWDNALSRGQIGEIYASAHNYEKALIYFYQSQTIFNEINDVRPSFLLLAQNRIARAYLLMGQLDSTEYHAKLALKISEKLAGRENWSIPGLYVTLGDLEKRKGNPDRSRSYYLKSIETGIGNQAGPHLKLAKLYREIGKLDSSIIHINRCLELLSTGSLYHNIAEVYRLLSSVYESQDQKKAYYYSELAQTYQDSLFNISRSMALETFIDFDQEDRQNELNAVESEFKNLLRTNALLGGSFTLIVIVLLLYRNNRIQKKSKRKTELAYERLRNTQSQLIQSEKMASLGELTAGIAHEIQNPLNFVNNFSEVNTELIDEANQEMDKGNTSEVKEILKDIKENESKINHHGKRADAIVKGMLQHSRSSSGQKELTDINALCDEYLRLSYHGLRAKDKSFNAKFETDFDASLPKINVVPQDIGRVILNLINNAFYAVSERAINQQLTTNNQPFTPTVTVSTKTIGDKIEIRVKDNGNGIPDNIKEKIFQPFFTTKPTGQGTGLGLSLSYDVVKSHGGEISVITKKGEGSEFIIQLPHA